MAHVLVLGNIHAAGLAVLAARADVTVELAAAASEAELIRRVPAADAILVRTNRVSGPVIDAAPRLKIVSRHGVGYDNVDLAALDRRGIPLTVVGDVNAVPVAEQTLYLMLALAKQAITYDRATRSGGWAIRDSFAATELAGKTLLLLGFGRIGRAVAVRAQAFGMQVAAYDPYVPAAAVTAAGCRPVVGLDEALGGADYVSVHLPLSAETRNIIDAGALARMKRSAVLICTARGGLVDEAALAQALRGKTLRAAGLDVFADEPPAVDNPLLGLAEVLLSPHTAALTQECAIRMAEISARNVLAGLDGRLDPALVVNGPAVATARRA
jgi:D-3-phosphoglycerate dehydrogenase